jgi:predicted MFS family arabinose efflux permease
VTKAAHVVAGGQERRNAAYGWYVVIVLMLCQVLSAVDSRLPFIMVEAIKRDLQLSDTQIGLITGAAFSLTYALCAIPIARLSDRGNRVAVIASAIVVWSGFTALAGFTRGFATFALSRIGVAAAEAALTPAAHAIISSHLDGPSRPKGLAVFSVGIAIGAFIAMALGGYVADRLGWRTAFMLVGATGVLLTPLVLFTVREPPQPKREKGTPSPHGSVATLVRDPVVRNVILGGTLLAFSAGALNSWGPAYVMRTFDLSATQTGASFGAVAGILATIGILAGGFISSWLSKRDPRHALTMLSVAFSLAMVAQVGALLSNSYVLFLVLIAISILFSSFYLGPTFAVIQSAVDPARRSFASAVALFSINGIGIASGSFVVGLLSDLFAAWVESESLRWSLICVTLVKSWSAAHYWRAGRLLPSPA